MWIYEKKLEFPVKITQPDARLAKIMIEQYGGAYSIMVYSIITKKNDSLNKKRGQYSISAPFTNII